MTETRLAVPLIGRQRHVETVHGWIADLAAGRGRAAGIRAARGKEQGEAEEHAGSLG